MEQVMLGWRREWVLSKDLPFPRAAGESQLQADR